MPIDLRTDILPLKNKLFRLALRITLDHAEAEDVVQETIIKVWSRRDEWPQIENIEAFCLTICRNLAVDKTRLTDNQAQTLVEAPLATHYSPLTALSPEDQLVQRDRIQLVRRLIDSLPEKQRSCMQLRDVEEKSYRDIADILGISEEQVKVNIFRARQTIRDRLRKIENEEK